MEDKSGTGSDMVEQVVGSDVVEQVVCGSTLVGPPSTGGSVGVSEAGELCGISVGASKAGGLCGISVGVSKAGGLCGNATLSREEPSSWALVSGGGTVLPAHRWSMCLRHNSPLSS